MDRCCARWERISTGWRQGPVPPPACPVSRARRSSSIPSVLRRAAYGQASITRTREIYIICRRWPQHRKACTGHGARGSDPIGQVIHSAFAFAQLCVPRLIAVSRGVPSEKHRRTSRAGEPVVCPDDVPVRRERGRGRQVGLMLLPTSKQACQAISWRSGFGPAVNLVSSIVVVDKGTTVVLSPVACRCVSLRARSASDTDR